MKPHLSADQFKLYNLVWRRFVASFMTPAVFDTVRVDIVAAQYVFRATGSHLKFPGFYAVWPREEDERNLPLLRASEVLNLRELKPEQHFTQPPPRFTEASLIKELEEQGIGRPSTYVPIISTIQDRGYVDQDQRRFVATWLGETVNEVMNKHFPDIVDTNFTSEMERKLDAVEEGRQSWQEFLHSFYDDFKASVKKAETEMARVEKPIEELDEPCPDCGRNLVIRTSRFGRFISCSGFPDCRYRRSMVNKTGALCPNCGGDLVERKTRQKKRIFYGCNNYPTCNFAMWEKPVPEPCPKCGGLMAVTKPGQDPICYNEVILPQRNEAKPRQDGAAAKARRTSKAAAEEAGEQDGVVSVAKKPATRKATTTRTKAATATAAKKATTTRAKAATATTAKKATTTRAKAAATKKATTTKKATVSPQTSQE